MVSGRVCVPGVRVGCYQLTCAGPGAAFDQGVWAPSRAGCWAGYGPIQLGSLGHWSLGNCSERMCRLVTKNTKEEGELVMSQKGPNRAFFSMCHHCSVSK